MSLPYQIDGNSCPRCLRANHRCTCRAEERARSEQALRAAVNDFNAGRITWNEYVQRVRESR